MVLNKDQYLIRFEFSKNDEIPFVADNQTSDGMALGETVFKLYENDKITVMAKVQGSTTGDWEEVTFDWSSLPMFTVLPGESYEWWSTLDLCVSY